MKYDKNDIPQFQEQVCKNTCIMKGKCIEEAKNEHWFLMCPHYFNWKLGIKTFVAEQLEWERNHPEEVEKAKAWKSSLKNKKKYNRKKLKKFSVED